MIRLVPAISTCIKLAKDAIPVSKHPMEMDGLILGSSPRTAMTGRRGACSTSTAGAAGMEFVLFRLSMKRQPVSLCAWTIHQVFVHSPRVNSVPNNSNPIARLRPSRSRATSRHAGRRTAKTSPRNYPSSQPVIAVGYPPIVPLTAIAHSAGSSACTYAASANCPLIVSPCEPADTCTVSPSFTAPSRISEANGFCSPRWITRFSGRAPYTLS